jgi:hypothetical protein
MTRERDFGLAHFVSRPSRRKIAEEINRFYLDPDYQLILIRK